MRFNPEVKINRREFNQLGNKKVLELPNEAAFFLATQRLTKVAPILKLELPPHLTLQDYINFIISTITRAINININNFMKELPSLKDLLETDILGIRNSILTVSHPKNNKSELLFKLIKVNGVPYKSASKLSGPTFDILSFNTKNRKCKIPMTRIAENEFMEVSTKIFPGTLTGRAV